MAGHHGRIAASSPNGGCHHVRAASDRSPRLSKVHLARLHRAAAGIRRPARRKISSDLEAHRACADDFVLVLMPTVTFADCPQLDVICVPGGAGTDDLVNDEETLDFLRAQAKAAKYVTSVCTGSLVLGAAGLLKGYNAATHWSAMQYLSVFGATPTKTRVWVTAPHNRRRRHCRHRFRADAGVDPDRPENCGSH